MIESRQLEFGSEHDSTSRNILLRLIRRMRNPWARRLRYKRALGHGRTPLRYHGASREWTLGHRRTRSLCLCLLLLLRRLSCFDIHIPCIAASLPQLLFLPRIPQWWAGFVIGGEVASLLIGVFLRAVHGLDRRLGD